MNSNYFNVTRRKFQLSLFLSLFSALLNLSTAQNSSIRLSDWGIADPSKIWMGQLSLLHTPRGDELRVQALYDSTFFASMKTEHDSHGCLDIADFSTPSINRLGGAYAGFELRGGSVSLVHAIDPSEQAYLNIEYSRVEGGSAGVWIHLFNSAAPRWARRYLDATAFTALHIRIRGRGEAGKIRLKLADDVWNDKEDALTVGDIDKFLPGGALDTSWRTATVPLSAVPERLDRTRLATLVLEPVTPGSGSFDLGTIALCDMESDIATPPRRRVQLYHEREDALWVWNTEDFLQKKEGIDDLIALAKRNAVGHIFLALPYDPALHKGGLNIDRVRMGPLIRSLNAAALKVHALVGDKDFVLPEKRSFVLSTIQNIVKYQKSSGPAEQWYGVHLDIEPHLLPGFNSPRQEWFLLKFLGVLDTCAKMIRDGGLVVGADVPTWLDMPNELTHLVPEVTWRGKLKPVYQHILDLMDNIVLMDYRTNVEGDDGILQHASGELRYAEQKGVKVFVGLEAAPLLDETLVRFSGPALKDVTDESRQYVLLSSGEGNVSIALVSGREARERLATLRGGVWLWPVGRSIPLSASRLSYASLGVDRMERAVKESDRFLSKWGSFGGFAIHHYASYRALLERR